MALIFMDGFDHYDPDTAAEIVEKWDGSSTTTYFEDDTGRSGSGNSLKITNSYGYVQKTVSNSQSEMIAGFAYKLPNAPSTNAYGSIFQVERTGAAYTPDGFNLSVNTDGKLFVRNGTTVLATASDTLKYNTWMHIECRFLLSDTVGEAEVRVNGNTTAVIDVDTVDTAGSEGTTITDFYFGCQDGTDQWFDDIFLLDTTGSVNNTFIGDCKVELLLPDGDEGTNDFTATGTGSTNADRVDEASSDDDTTYNASSTTTDKDLYTYGSLGGTIGTVLGVQILSYVKKDDDGSAVSVRNICKHSTSTGNGATEALTTSYVLYPTMYELNPSTSSAWTEAEVNAMSAGLEIM